MPRDAAHPRFARRLRLATDGHSLRLVSQQVLRMRPFPSDGPAPQGPWCGFRVELRDRADQLLWGRVLEFPFREGVEVPDPENRGYRWVDSEEPRPELNILVPEIGAPQVVFLGSPDPDGDEPARELARFDLGPPGRAGPPPGEPGKPSGGPPDGPAEGPRRGPP